MPTHYFDFSLPQATRDKLLSTEVQQTTPSINPPTGYGVSHWSAQSLMQVQVATVFNATKTLVTKLVVIYGHNWPQPNQTSDKIYFHRP